MSNDNQITKQSLKNELAQLEKMNCRRDERINNLEDEKNEADNEILKISEEV